MRTACVSIRIHAASAPSFREWKRVGHTPSEAELSEAIGVSREWYDMIESYPQVRVTLGLLVHLAEALMLGAAERKMLCRIAMPEISDIGVATVTV